MAAGEEAGEDEAVEAGAAQEDAVEFGEGAVEYRLHGGDFPWLEQSFFFVFAHGRVPSK